MAVSRAILTFERVKRARGNQANGVNSSEEFLGLENRWKKVDNKMGMRTTRRLDELFKFFAFITGASVGASEHMGKIPRVAFCTKRSRSTARMEIFG
jgi:hypothetical protein